MPKSCGLPSPLLCVTLALLAGCSSGTNFAPAAATSTTATKPLGPPPTYTPPSAPPPSNRAPSVFIVDNTHDPQAVAAFSKSATNVTDFTFSISGILPSVDAAGNLYLLSGTDIMVYSSSGPVRVIHTGSAAGVSKVVDMMASQSGELYVLDGSGIAVFSSTASGDDKPTRYIVPQTPAAAAYYTFTLDNAGNLYLVGSDNSIFVFDATANGSVQPLRTIQTSGFSSRFITLSMATDKTGNLYVLTLYYYTPENYDSYYGVVEFAANADGKASPIANFTTPDAYPWACGDAVAVDSAGMVYVSSGGTHGPCLVYEFAPDTAGKNIATNTVSVVGWTDSIASRMAVDF